MKIAALALALVLAATSCAAYSQAFAAKPRDEQEAFQRCRVILMQRQCPGASTTDSMGQLMCLNALADAFAHAPDGRRWLVRNGCPSEMVD